jgi:hypothetical protein
MRILYLTSFAIVCALALGAAALLLSPSREMEVYGTFSRDDLSQIKRLAMRHTRGVALMNLSRSIHKPRDIPDALWQVLSCRVCVIERCWNSEVCVHVGSQSFGTFLVLVSSNGNWCIRGSRSFPPPRQPVPDADPFRRQPVSILVPTGLRIARKGNTFDYVFTGFEAAHLTVGYKMVTGVSEEVGTSINMSYGGPLPCEIPTPSVWPQPQRGSGELSDHSFRNRPTPGLPCGTQRW